MRKIIHIDMDSFFASVEQRDFPEHVGKALVVGHRGPRSVVAAASYEARKYGIFSAMPMSTALQKCPHLIVMPHRFDAYTEVSRNIRNIFHEYTDLVEPLSLDEAYLDVTDAKKGPASASLIAKEIKNEIKKRVGLIASAGVSYNKFLAKIASDMDKPDGFFLIKPADAESFLEDLDIGLFYGVGKKTEEKMHKMNIFKGRDLKLLTRPELIQHFGKAGIYFYDVVRGIDERSVVSFRERKSIGAERTYETDIFDIDEIKEKLTEVINIMWQRCEAKQMIGKTITMKLRFADFTTITRSNTHNQIFTKEKIKITLIDLLPNEEIKERGVRLLGATMSHFKSENKQDQKQLKIDFDFNEFD
ncbi:MAG: DNA polymerase IV [Bacteroidales bacterium]|nr:DNA polymerase IV [Bacteroidales bacterium]